MDVALNETHRNETKETLSDADFDTFWSAYPRKADKGAARNKYRARIRDGVDPDTLLLAAKNYAARVQAEGTDQKFVKHAATFLSPEGAWEEHAAAAADPADPTAGMTEAQRDRYWADPNHWAR